VQQLNVRARWNDAPEQEERTDSREDPQFFFPQFPQWMPSSLLGTLKRYEEQRIFCVKNNTATSIKRDSSGAVVVHPRSPTFTQKSPCDDSFFVNTQLVGASELEKLAHGATVVAGIFRKEMLLMPGGKLHSYVGRFYGTSLKKILSYCTDSYNKTGNMRLYRSHFVECGAIRNGEDHGIFHLHHLEFSNMVMMQNLQNADSPVQSTLCHKPGESCLGKKCTHLFTVYYMTFIDSVRFYSVKELRLMFPGRVRKKQEVAGQSKGIGRINKKAKLDEENLKAQAHGWKYQCKECLKSNQKTFIIKWTEPVNGPNGPRDMSYLCLSQCRRNKKDQTKFVKSQYKFVQTIN